MMRSMVERVLQDGEDRQTQRGWYLEVDGQHLTLRRTEGGEHLLLMRVEDIDLFIEDLKRVRELGVEPPKP